MTPDPQSAIRLDLYFDGVFIRTVVLTLEEIRARTKTPAEREGEPPRLWFDADLPLGGWPTLVIGMRRRTPDDRSTNKTSYTWDSRSASEFFSAKDVTTFVYNNGNIRREDGSEPPPDEPHVTG